MKPKSDINGDVIRQVGERIEQAREKGYVKPFDMGVAAIAQIEAMGFRIVRDATVERPLEALRLIEKSEGFNGGTWAGELQKIARDALAEGR